MKWRSVNSAAVGALLVIPLLTLAAGQSQAQQVIVPTDATNWTFHSMIPVPNTQHGAQAYLAKWHLSGLSAVSNDLIYSFPATDLIEDYNNSHLQLKTPEGDIELRDHGITTPLP